MQDMNEFYSNDLIADSGSKAYDYGYQAALHEVEKELDKVITQKADCFIDGKAYLSNQSCKQLIYKVLKELGLEE